MYKTEQTKGLSNDKNPMDPINKVHRFFKRFMKSHGGYNRSDIQDWCNLFSFIWNHKDNLPNMVKDILQLSISTHKVIRFRDKSSRNPD